MDYAEGGELSTLLKEKGSLTEEESKKIWALTKGCQKPLGIT